MRILMAMAGSEHGGAEAFFERLALAFKNHDLVLSALIRRQRERALRLRAGGVRLKQALFGGPIDVVTGWALRRELARFAPDIVLSFMSRAAAAVPSGGRFVHIGRLGGYYPLKYYRGCSHLVVNTPDLERYVVNEGWPAEHVHLVPNFVDSRNADPERREAHETPAEAPLVLALGRLHANKGFEVLIEALCALPDVYLWLAGAGPEEFFLRQAADRLGVEGRERFLGWCHDPSPLYAAADVVAVPSRHEPLGNVVLEAWARAKPVVAAASEGPQQLIVSGENGFLVPVDDANALAFALRHVLDETALRRHLAEGGYAAYRERYTEEAIVNQYLDLFRRILGRPAAA